MDPINEIQTIRPIQGAYVRVDYIPSLYYRPWGIVEPNVDYLIPPVVLQIGSPIVDMPGCVQMHQDNKIHKTNIPKDKDLFKWRPIIDQSTLFAGPTFQVMARTLEAIFIIRKKVYP